MGITENDIEEGKKISSIFAGLSEEDKTMAIIYMSALKDKEIATIGQGESEAVE